MKEKTKKVVKSLGVGALLCAGAFTFAGCSLNAEDKALVENKVAELQQQLADNNSLLEEQNNLINQQMLVDRTWGLLQTAQAKLMLNVEGIRDNLVMEYTLQGQTNTSTYYKAPNGDYIYEHTDGCMYYEDSSGIYSYHPRNTVGSRRDKTSYSSFEVVLLEFNIFNFLEGLSKENISRVEILNDGNYKVTFTTNDLDVEEEGDYREKGSTIQEFVISNDAKIVCVNFSSLYIQKWEGEGDGDCEYDTEHMLDAILEFKYGAVDAEEILIKYADVKDEPLA